MKNPPIARAVFGRTCRGQRAAIADPSPLPQGQQRLLLLVNGYTPLGELSRLLPEDEVTHLARQLIVAGLIALVSRFPAPGG